jgi:hypothetical protein
VTERGRAWLRLFYLAPPAIMGMAVLLAIGFIGLLWAAIAAGANYATD